MSFEPGIPPKESLSEHEESGAFPVPRRAFLPGANARVNAPAITDPVTTPALIFRPVPQPPATKPTELSPPSAAFAQRPVARRQGLRILPLAGFRWGTDHGPLQPREDHTLLRITQGWAKLRLPTGEQRAEQGSLCFIPRGTGFACLHNGLLQGRVLLISPCMATTAPSDLPRHPLRLRLSQTDPQEIDTTLNALSHEIAHDDSGSEQALTCLLGLLAVQLHRLATQTCRGGTAGDLVDRFMTLATDQLGSGLTLSELAHELGTTSAELDSACRDRHGQPALALIYHLRFQQAVRLLRDTRLQPGEIARRLGYASLAHFTRTFAAETGRSPEHFRAQSI